MSKTIRTNDAPGLGALPIILFCYYFARVFYGTYNETAMLVANDVSLTVCNCTIISATVSHNYSDIGTIKIDAYT